MLKLESSRVIGQEIFFTFPSVLKGILIGIEDVSNKTTTEEHDK